MDEINLHNLTDIELLRWVDRANPEVRELAERLERALEFCPVDTVSVSPDQQELKP